MAWDRVAAVTLRTFYLLRGSFSRVFPLFAWVGIDIILYGFLTRYLNSVSSAGFDFVPVLLGAVLLYDFFVRIMQGIAGAFFEDVWSRNFLNLFSTPITLWEYLAGLVLAGVATSLAGLIGMLLIATFGFGLAFFSLGLNLALFLLILCLFGMALGILGASLVLRWGPSAEWFIWPIPALLMPFAGVLYPLSVLPAWMRALSRLLPPAYVFENLRGVQAHLPVSTGNLAWALVLACLHIGLAGWVFSRVFRRAVRTGLIARFSSETVN